MGADLMLLLAGPALLAIVLLYYFVWRRALARAPEAPTPPTYPTVTVIRPIRGLDAGARENLQAALALDYPARLQTFFVLDGPDDPAVPLVREALAAHDPGDGHHEAAMLFCGEPPAGRTGKLNAMIYGLQRARGELIAFCDSDVRTTPDALTRLVGTLLADRANGSAFAPVVVSEPPATFGDAGYALMLNALYGPVTAAVAREHDNHLPFIMGQFMVLTRHAIRAIGGLESAGGQLVDDMYLGARVNAVGLRNRVANFSVRIVESGLTWPDFWKVYVRWIAFSRSGLPGLGFRIHAAVPVAACWLGLVAMGVALTQGWWVAAAVNALVPGAVTAMYDRLHRHMGGARLRPAHWLAPLVVTLMAPAVLLAVFLGHKVSWRGHVYDLDSTARLAGGEAIPEDAPYRR